MTCCEKRSHCRGDSSGKRQGDDPPQLEVVLAKAYLARTTLQDRADSRSSKSQSFMMTTNMSTMNALKKSYVDAMCDLWLKSEAPFACEFLPRDYKWETPRAYVRIIPKKDESLAVRNGFEGLVEEPDYVFYDFPERELIVRKQKRWRIWKESDYSVLYEAMSENARLIAKLENTFDMLFRDGDVTRTCNRYLKKRHGQEHCWRMCHAGCDQCVVHCNCRGNFVGVVNHMRVPYVNDEFVVWEDGWTREFASEREIDEYYLQMDNRVKWQKIEERQRRKSKLFPNPVVGFRKKFGSMLQFENERGKAQSGRDWTEFEEAAKKVKSCLKTRPKFEVERAEERAEKQKKKVKFCERSRKRDEKESGRAQFGIDLSSTFTVEHVFKIPGVEKFLEMCSQRAEKIDFRYVMKEFLLACVHSYQAGFSWSSIATSSFHFLSNIRVGEQVVNFMMRNVTKLFNPNVQAPVEITPGMIVSGGFSILGLLIVALTTKSLPAEKSVDTFLMKMTRLGSTLNCVDKLQDKVSPILEQVVDYVRVQWFGYTSSELNEWKLYDAWCKEVTEMNTVDFEARVKTDEKLKVQIDELIIRGDNIMKRLDSLRIPPSQRARFTACTMFLQRARTEAASSSAGMHIPRVPPVLFHFVGATGVGKSEMTHRLNAKLLASIGVKDPKALHTLIYFRTPGQERFDGFRTEMKGVVCDDFGSVKDSQVNPSGEAFEAIRMQNSAVWPLDMAHLSEKGNVFFRAQWVIWTSNRSHFNFDSVTNPEAILRRVTYKFLHRPHPDYAVVRVIGKQPVVTLDEQKVEREAKEDPSVYERCWQFDLVDAQASGGVEQFRFIEHNLTFEQVCKMCVDKLRERQEAGKEKLDHLDEFFRKCIAEEEERGRAQIFGISGFTQENESVHVDLCRSFDEELIEVTEVDRDGRPKEWPHLDFSDLYGAGCVRARNAAAAKMFLTAYGSAMAYAETFPFEMRHERFSFAMFDLLKCNPRTFTRCEEPSHQSDAFWKRFKMFAEKAHQKYSEGWQRWRPSFLDWGFEELAAYVTSFVVCMAAAYVTEKVVHFVMRKTVSKEKVAAHLEKYYTEEEVTTFLRMYGYVESFQDRTVGPRQKNVESYQDITRGSTKRNVECLYGESDDGVKCPCGCVVPRSEVWTSLRTGELMCKCEVQRRERSGKAESTTDVNAMEVSRKVEKNLYGLSMRDGESWAHLGNAFFIGGRVAITNRHIAEVLRGVVRISNENLQKGIEVPVSVLNIGYLSDEEMKDVAVIEFPRSVPLHADLRKHFMTREDFQLHSELKKMMMIGVNERNCLRSRVTDIVQAKDRVKFVLNDGKTIRYVRDWYKYGCETQPGDCGAVLVAFDQSFERKLFGIHMAGHDNDATYTGVGCAIHRETIEKLVESIDLRWPESLIDGEVPLPSGSVQGARGFEGDFVHLAKVPRVHSSVKSKIKPSPVYGVIAESTTKPAHLCDFYSNGELISPLEIARKKASTKNVTLEREVLDACQDHYEQVLFGRVVKKDLRVLTFKEAIAGIEGDDAYKGIKRNTSPGYGWPKSGKGKTAYLGEDEYKFDHPEVLRKYDEMLERVKSGQRSGAIWTDTLKDERRPIEKVDAGKTRLFAASEMTYVILFRRYFMGFAAHMFRNRIDIESCVGINPYSQEWTKLAQMMMEVGEHVIAGDFSNYDGTLAVEMLWRCLDVVENFYRKAENWTEEDARVRRMLWLDIVHSVHVSGTDLYMWTHSQPSGCPITAILNSLYHSLAARYVYILCARKYAPELVALSNFTRYVRHGNYGDDDLYNISPEIIDWFNQETMTEMFDLLGMTYTDEAKTGNIVKSRKLSEVAFLKRRFRYDTAQGRFRAPLSLDTIKDMAMWVKRDRDHWQLTAETLEEAMLELAQHERKVFDAERAKFDEARGMVAVRTPCIFNTYDLYQEVEFNKYCMA